jgi:hypothetical protein
MCFVELLSVGLRIVRAIVHLWLCVCCVVCLRCAWCVMPSATLFHELVKAQQLLCDPVQRAEFDQQRSARMQREERFRKMDAENQKRRLGMSWTAALRCAAMYPCVCSSLVCVLRLLAAPVTARR